MGQNGKHQGSEKINFWLNPDLPKERIILEFLRKHAANRDASAVIKASLYETATGRSWLTDQLLQPVVSVEEDSPVIIQQDHLLEDMLQGLDDWMT